MQTFSTTYTDIIEQITTIDPVEYAKTRNYTNGMVSKLSPYISRGVISTKMAYTILRKKYSAKDCEHFLKELLWREYFQRLLQNNTDILSTSTSDTSNKIPDALLNATTGITALDTHIHKLLTTGYMHNHVRMYTASVCNMASYDYNAPAHWMYYHLLDGDVASNYYSWQWVYGLQTGKKYIFNQENINRFCGTTQTNTFLDKSYEEMEKLTHVEELSTGSEINLFTSLPDTDEISIDTNAPILLYNSYNLDPTWHANQFVNRILILEPSHFSQYPVSEKVINFIVQLAQNIQGIQLYVGEYKTLKAQYNTTYIAKEHPLFIYEDAIIEPRDWLAPEVTESYPSYSKYLKKVKEKQYEYFT
ncbi:FAD-binding domain-containing protein [Neptunitalea lumnitzerae]|uniref:Cryptochrome/DNA photolyase FAD-binding domain-containing protein n=1 Tax=Neptunitalea lumnitzerae TaxID=2965509 RepID=A0ABQ5MJ85_9FLAO|nr:FAD-binding domain-containing protein [Neptunitalea sp. Y10]GLB49387.1 hypothetical protein Y10_17550 [Neptunitalea sp. Y10]